MKKRKYDFILSFGEACFTAHTMKSLKIRQASGPFDWMYGATFEERFNIILNKFENFFDKNDLVYEKRDVVCEVYLNKQTHIHFNHDFPHDSDFNEMYPIIQKKYARRISRVLSIFNQNKKILLLYIDLPDTNRGLNDNQKLIELFSKLKNVYPNSKFDLLYIKHNSNLKKEEVIYNKLNNNITIAECYNKSTDPKAEAWQANFQNTKEVLKIVGIKYHLANYLKMHFNKCKNRLCAKYSCWKG